jgi:hypothetical protein
MQKQKPQFHNFCRVRLFNCISLYLFIISSRLRPSSFPSLPLVMLTWAREQEMKNASASKLDLTDYLIKPVQRICKYPLLFRVRPITPIPFSAALTVTLTAGPDANTLCSVPAGADQEHRHGGEPEGVRQVARD